MDEKIKKIREVFNDLFERSIYERSYIESLDQDPLVISANEEGFLYLIDIMIGLCEKKIQYAHFHFDEAGMLDKCEKEFIIRYLKTPWHAESAKTQE